MTHDTHEDGLLEQSKKTWTAWTARLRNEPLRLTSEDSATLVVPMAAEEVFWKLRQATKPAGEPRKRDDYRRYLFNGTVYQSYFELSRTLPYANSFIPLVEGDVNETKLGSIIFLRFRMFSSTRFWLLFWSALCLLFAGVFTFWAPHLPYLLLSLAALGLNVLISLLNYSRQKRITKELFYRLFSA